MSYMSMIAIDIEEMLFDGFTVEEISKRTQMSVEQINAYINDLENAGELPFELEYEDCYPVH